MLNFRTFLISIIVLVIAILLIFVMVSIFAPSIDRENEMFEVEEGNINSTFFSTDGRSISPIAAEDDTIVVHTLDGDVVINDVRDLPQTEYRGEGFYALVPLEEELNSDYGALFSESDGSIAVALTSEPISKTRIDTEQKLLSILGIEEIDMCKLTIFVGVPHNVNPFLSGQNLGLSFCPGSVELD